MYLSYYVEFVIESVERQLKETKEILAANKKNSNENMSAELKLIQTQQEIILKQLKLLMQETSVEKD